MLPQDTRITYSPISSNSLCFNKKLNDNLHWASPYASQEFDKGNLSSTNLNRDDFARITQEFYTICLKVYSFSRIKAIQVILLGTYKTY